ncbi:MAG: pantoate--beta-alanine ligase [Campylobacteraceae bacterium 4484_166]|nr:MAG: pantoate--beta-alanine ligase [Campylobacteraceae bacterium 4484_166]
MKIFESIKDIKGYLKQHQDKTIGFVPTMGALHEGHISLIKEAKKECGIVVVSIFVNPTQFLPHEDLDRYPSKPQADEKICDMAKVDILFKPTKDEIYKKNGIQLIAPNDKAYILEGFDRPAHFDGVLQVLNKLFNIIKPTKAYFGKKDAQQLYLIENMIRDFFMDIEIVPCETVREINGLAVSSRNIYLKSDQLQKSLKISKSLKTAVKLVQSGENTTENIINTIKEKLDGLDIKYIQIVDRNFNLLEKIELNNTIILVAVNINNTRLIDNIWL